MLIVNKGKYSMSCKLHIDHPFRVRIVRGMNKGVVHAAREVSCYHTRAKRCYTTACSTQLSSDLNYEITKKYLIPNTEKISCKRCMRVLGFIETDTSKRYVLYNKETGEYFSKRCWVEEITDAELYRTKQGPLYHGKRRVYRDKNGKEITREEFNTLWREVGWNVLLNEMKYTINSEFNDEKYEIREVTITVT